MNTMNIKKELLTALSDFQAEVPVIFEASSNDFGKYKYADLKQIVRIINPLLKKNGLVTTQFVDGNALVTMVIHIETQQFIESRMDLISGVQLKGMNDFQIYGSQLTYFRRYGLAQLLGLITDADNDASGDQNRTVPAPAAAAAPVARTPKALDDKAFNEAITAIESNQYTKAKLEKNYALTAAQSLTLKNLKV